jgi:sugar-specific transcriptional regulator TrmB
MLDLTPFHFTPTESHVYEVLVTRGPGTGYAIARAAGLARANAYSALEGLVSKGAARADEGRPKRYRPEPPQVLLGRILDRQGRAVDDLAEALSQVPVSVTQTVAEVSSLRGVIHFLTLEIARAAESVEMVLPGESYASLAPALRRAAGAGIRVLLYADGESGAAVPDLQRVTASGRWPGRPLVAVIDGRLAVVGTVEGERVNGHQGTAPAFVAAAGLALAALGGTG